MNVCIISPEFPPLTNWGGIATFNYQLAILLSKIKHKVHILTYDSKGNASWDETLIENRLYIHYVKFKTDSKLINFFYYRFPFGLIRKIIKKFYPLFIFTLDWNIFSFLAFQKLYEQVPFDVIHTPIYYSPAFLIALKYRRIPIINHAQGPQSFFNKYEPVSFDNKLKSLMEDKYMEKYSKYVISCSQDLEQKIIQKLPKLNKKIFYMPNWLTFSCYFNKEPINIDNIIYMGRLEYRKGVDLLLKAFVDIASQKKDVKLWLIGEPASNFPHNKSFIDIYTMVKKMSLSKSIVSRIFFLPRIDERRTLIEVLKKLKGIAVFPSRYEPFGFVTIEAMALGYIVIASKNGGGKEIISNQIDGFLIKPCVEDIKKTLNKVISMSNEEINCISFKAVNKIKDNFNEKIARLKLKQIYSKLLSSIEDIN